MIIDRSTWGRIRVTGGDRVRFLQGLTTVNVDKLAAGDHQWGAILSPKGRVLSVIDVAALAADDEAFILTCEPALADATHQLLDRYAVMDDVVFERVDAPLHQTWTDAASVWTAPFVDGAGPGADPMTEVLRIRAGFPVYGADVDDDHFPFETPLAKFLDYKKGCYVGQEPVFRVYAQGQAARMLRGLAVEGTAPLAAGTVVAHAAKDKAGTITSSIVDPAEGRTVALAYLHRTTWDPGGSVTVDGRPATVYELPW
ncbi:MAG: hypothetical protein NT062_13745 [Proteobacteria bacterium]|nr:hypothetical protein [Pseudomonadota bacterium]